MKSKTIPYLLGGIILAVIVFAASYFSQPELFKGMLQAVPWGAPALPAPTQVATTEGPSIPANARISAMSAGQIENLSSTWLAIAPSSEFARLSTEQLQAFTVNHIKVLQRRQIQAISPEVFASLSEEQLGAFTLEQMKYLSAEQLAALSEDQLESFSSNQVKVLTLEQTNLLSAAQKRALAK